MSDSAPRNECRIRPRYKLDLELRFSYHRGRRTYLGTGRTKNFSDKAVCFESDQELPAGVSLELCITWPAFLQGLYPLEMVVRGALVRKQNSLVVLNMEQYEFRTRGDASFHSRTNNEGAICDVLA
jgi:hypothetical protein